MIIDFITQFKQIIWPSTAQLKQLSLIVLIAILVCAFAIFAFDGLASLIITFIINL